MNIPEKKDIEQAYLRIEEYIHLTDCKTSTFLNNLSDSELYFKCENFQKIGAFKIRGAMNTILQIPAESAKNGVVTHSSGNHAQAVSLAAALLNIPAYIVMPENAPKVKVEAVKGYGGLVKFCKATLDARESEMEKIRADKNALFIPPYDHPQIIAGQATAAMELLRQADKSLDYLIAPVGGGGLLAGTALAVKYFGSKETKIIGAEPLGADDAHQSFLNKKLIPQKAPNTIADGLLTSLGTINFKIIMDEVEEILCVDDQDIINSMKLVWERMKMIIEPSSAVPLAAVLKNKEKFQYKRVGIIISGGNIDLNRFFNVLT